MTYRKQLRELAFDRHGVVTTAAAVAAGVPAVEVRKLAGRGALCRRGHGVYRMLEVPAGPLDEYAEAVALAGPDALLADEAVLAVHGLAQVNLRRIRVASPHRVRARLPPTVELVHRNVPAGQRDYVDGIPAMSLEAALVACRGRIMTERLIDATRAAAARGLLVPRAKTRVLAALSGMNDSRPANRYG
jgi:predicted transcriptional regulator of viral defense system